MVRITIAVLTCVLLAIEARAQSPVIQSYLNSPVLKSSAADVAKKDPSVRTDAEIRSLLPHQQSQSYVNFIRVNRARTLLDVVEALRLNKIVTSPPGTGGTSLVSRVAVPAVLGAAIEYGGILQQTAGQVTTLRGNALGIGRMLFGSEQFPYCPEIDSSGCGLSARVLRSISGAISLEDKRKTSPGTTPAPPTAADLTGDDFRTASWSVRIDVTPSNHLDDPKYVKAWSAAIDQLKKDPTAPALSQSIVAFFKTALTNEVYTTWMSDTVAALKKTSTEAGFYDVLENRLLLITEQLAAADPQFTTNVAQLSRAYENYFLVRDTLVREAQVHKMSLELTNLRPLDKPKTWNARFVYSHQPTLSPTLLTANLSSTWYANEGPNGERWRDIQAAAQLDRRLSEIPRFGYAVASFGFYYQWMRDDALITIPSGTTAPGSGIELPAEASTLLDTKGRIVIFQSQLTIPMGETVKVPFSVTWANRSELIKEKDVRAQIGMTLDLDGLFH
jgi:hypothetical protein